MAEDIDVLSVGLTANGKEFAEEVDQLIEDAREKFAQFSEDIEDDLGDVFELMGKDMENAVDEVIHQMTVLNQSLEDVASRVSKETGLAFDELVANTEIAMERIRELTTSTTDVIVAGLAGRGVIVSPEQREILEAWVETQIKMAKAMGDSGEAAEFLRSQIESAIPIFAQEINQVNMVNEAMEIAKRVWREAGQEMPIEKTAQLQARLNKLAETAKELGVPLERVHREMRRIAQESGPARTQVQQLTGAIAGWIEGLVGVGLAVKAWQKLREFLRESIAIGREAREEMERLVIATREHQRAVGEQSPTIAENIRQVEKLVKTYQITANEARRLVGQSMLLTENLDLNSQQLFKLQEAAVTYAKVFDKDVMSVLQQFTRFLNTGQKDALQGLGFQFKEHTLEVEAVKRGYIGLTDELNENARVMVASELLFEAAEEKARDLALTMTDTEKALADTTTAFDTQQEALGKRLLPAWEVLQASFKAFGAIVLAGLNEQLRKLDEGLKRFVDRLFAVQQTFELIRKEGFGEIVERGGMAATIRGFREIITEEREVAEAMKKLADETEENLQRANAAAEKFSDEITAGMRRAGMAIEDAIRNYRADADKLERDLTRSLLSIEADFERRRKQAGLNLHQDLRDIERDAAEDRLDAQRDYHHEEERALEDHRIAMDRLEKDYLWNLEDAVRERDARAVLELRRRYRRERNEAEEDFDLRRKRRREDFELELAEIERQRRIKRQQRIDAFNEEIIQLAEQEALKRQMERDRFNERLKELEERYNERLRIEGRKLADSLDLNATHAEELRKMLIAMYGENGFVVGVISGIMDYLSQANLVLPGVSYPATSYMDPNAADGRTLVGGSSPTGGDRRLSGGAYGSYYGRQRGGTMFATSPQMIQVGETPERVDFTRLSASTGAPRERQGAGGDKIAVRLLVDLGDGLIGEVVDKTMGEVADVFVNISGNNRQGMGRR